MSLLTSLTQVCRRIGITAPAAMYASTDKNIIQLIGIANEEGQELSARYPWQNLIQESNFQTKAATIQGSVTELAGADFRYILNDIMWDRTLLRPVFGPLAPQEWQALAARNVNGPYNQFRIRRNNVIFIPEPSAGDDVYFEWVSRNWVNTSGQTVVSSVTGETYTLQSDAAMESDGAQQYVSLPGTSGDYVSTPDSTALDITGDIQIIVYVAADSWTPVSTQVIAAKSVASTSQVSWRLSVLASGLLQLITSADGSTLITSPSTTAPTIGDGSGLWIKVTVDVDNGAVGNTVTFYTSLDPVQTAVADVDWTQLGTAVTNAGTTSIFASTALLELGSASAGTLNNFAGSVYKAYIYSGIAGTLVAGFNADDGTVGASAWSADTDTSFLDEEIITQGIIWRWKQVKGLDYAEDFAKYEGMVNDAMGRDGGKARLSLSGSGIMNWPAGVFVPLGSWNLV